MTDDLGALKKELAELRERRKAYDDPKVMKDADGNYDHKAANDRDLLDHEIGDREVRIRLIEHPSDANNPNVVRDDVDLLTNLAEPTVSARRRMDFDQDQKRQAEVVKQREIDAAAATAARIATQGDLERAVYETSGDDVDPTVMDNARASDDMIKRNGCTPGVMAGIGAAVIIAAVIFVATGMGGGNDDKPKKCANALGVGMGEVALPVGADCPDGAAAPSDPNATVFTGSSGGPVGCVPCDGDARFIPIKSPPGPGAFPGAAGKGQADIELGPGTIQNLRVEVSGTDRGRWSASVVGLGCTLEPGDTSCVAAGPYELTEATMVSLIVGNDGDPDIYANPNGQMNPNGSPVPLVQPDSDGAFEMTFTFEYIPASS